MKWIAFAIFAVASPLHAQSASLPGALPIGQHVTQGDAMRIRGPADRDWTEGSLLAISRDSIVLDTDRGNARRALANLRVQRWEGRSAGPPILIWTMLFVVADLGAQGLNESRRPWTGHRLGEIGIFAGAGLAIGYGDWALNSGHWQDGQLQMPSP